MENQTDTFYGAWNEYMIIGGFALLIIAGLILLYYEYRVLILKDNKDKYDYVNLHEVRYFWYAVLSVLVAAMLFANTVASHKIETAGMIWFYVRIFLSISFALVVYFISDSLVRIYYPRTLEKRLNKIRNKPRVSPQGNLMRKVAEEEEGAHLEADQMAIQGSHVHSVDYDVWIDEKTGFKKIEKYVVADHSVECPECGYFTMRIYDEEIERVATTSEQGLLLKHYKCTYCHHREMQEEPIAKIH